MDDDEDEGEGEDEGDDDDEGDNDGEGDGSLVEANTGLNRYYIMSHQLLQQVEL